MLKGEEFDKGDSAFRFQIEAGIGGEEVVTRMVFPDVLDGFFDSEGIGDGLVANVIMDVIFLAKRRGSAEMKDVGISSEFALERGVDVVDGFGMEGEGIDGAPVGDEGAVADVVFPGYLAVVDFEMEGGPVLTVGGVFDEEFTGEFFKEDKANQIGIVFEFFEDDGFARGGCAGENDSGSHVILQILVGRPDMRVHI